MLLFYGLHDVREKATFYDLVGRHSNIKHLVMQDSYTQDIPCDFHKEEIFFLLLNREITLGKSCGKKQGLHEGWSILIAENISLAYKNAVMGHLQSYLTFVLSSSVWSFAAFNRQSCAFEIGLSPLTVSRSVWIGTYLLWSFHACMLFFTAA